MEKFLFQDIRLVEKVDSANSNYEKRKIPLLNWFHFFIPIGDETISAIFHSDDSFKKTN